jgi:hypothetical protein
MKPETYALARHMLDKLGNPSKELTEWEENFITSITEFIDARGYLTPKQMETLERIYAEKTE